MGPRRSPILTVSADHFAHREALGLWLHGIKFRPFVQGLCIAANAVTFVIKFLVFNYLIFANRTSTRCAGSVSNYEKLG